MNHLGWGEALIFAIVIFLAFALGVCWPRENKNRVSNARLHADSQGFRYLRPYVGGGDCK